MIAGTGTGGSAFTQFQEPGFIYIDANDTLYVADHHNYRVQKWPKGAATGTRIVNIGTGADHPESITFDKNGNLYVTGHNYQRVLRYPPNFSSGTTVAGTGGSTGSTTSLMNDPLGMDVDDNLNLYVAERENKRVVKWAPSASSGIIVVNAGVKATGLLLYPYSSNQVHFSSEEANVIYLWTFGASSPSVTLSFVNSSTSTMKSPRGIKYDIYGNLYVADKGNKRVVMFCANRTTGRVVMGDSGTTPALGKPQDIAFDSQMNLYVSDEDKQAVFKYDLL